MKKILTMAICALMTATVALAGCRGRNPNLPEPPDADKVTVLTVSNYGAGFGSSWLTKAKARFEEKYAETRFEPGKKGVFIDIQPTLSSGMGWVNQVPSKTEEIFFTEQVYYPDAVANKYFLNITDIVTENMSDTQGENKTVEGKLTAEQQAYYKIDGQYYGLPHYAGYFGIVYDIDLFDLNNLYFNASRTGLIGSGSETKSVGLDGIPGTDDDGLPMTYDEMFTLCTEMRNRGITPFIWTGKTRTGYIDAFLNALAADYEGLDDFMLNFELSGTAHNLVREGSLSSDAQGKITGIETYSDEIGLSTGYKVYQSAGRAYALSFLDRIISGEYFSEKCKDESFANTEAQREFLESRPFGSSPIAMLIDGNFWDVEAGNAFYEIENDYPGDQWKRENRKFGFMPYPKATESDVNDGLTLFDYLYSCAFINAKIDPAKVTAAKTFLQFLYTDESLVEFTAATNTPKALLYDLTGDQLAGLSKFGQTVWNMRRAADIAYPFADNEVYMYAQSNFNQLNVWRSLVGNVTKNSMVDAVRKDGLHADALFEGLAKYYTESRWEQLYGSHF